MVLLVTGDNPSALALAPVVEVGVGCCPSAVVAVGNNVVNEDVRSTTGWETSLGVGNLPGGVGERRTVERNMWGMWGRLDG